MYMYYKIILHSMAVIEGTNFTFYYTYYYIAVCMFVCVCVCVCAYIYTHTHTHTQGVPGGTKLRESVPYVELYRYNPKHLCPKLNGYGDNGQRSLKL